MANWFITMKKADFKSIADKYHISQIAARLIRNRDVVEEKDIDLYLNGTISDLYDGLLMKDVSKAIEILADKINKGKKIRVIGDYDIDGVNATYILQRTLKGLGANVDTDIPDRIKDGYGLNQLLIERAAQEEVDTIITCDNGIAAAKEIAYGKEMGLTIIVTDHHEVPYEEADGKKMYQLPPADAVIDPKQKDCEYPFQGLCGAAVAYKLMEALYTFTGRDAEELRDLIENVAIATIGDVMDLTGENRIFVKHGLDMLKRTKNLGIKALMACNSIEPENLNTYHIGFVLGPCINACGRLDTAKRALELLCAENERDAAMLAGELKALNDSRKEMTAQNVEKAIEMVESSAIKKDKVLVLFLPECHESIAGIVAGRIKEQYYRPTFILTKGNDEVKGSGRSIEAYNMYEGLNHCRMFLTKFGGHKMAAGVSMAEENIDAFRSKINLTCTLSEDDLEEKISIDMQLPFEYVTKEFIGELHKLEPFGMKNRKPLFVEKDLKVIHPRILGKNLNVLKMQVENIRGTRMDAIYFGNAQECLDHITNQSKIMCTYYPVINEYKGNQTIQITIVNYR